MSPDIEWRIGEEADDETIARVNPPAARWRAGAVAIVVAAGLGLGLLYSSVPEPPPRPTAPPASIIPQQNLGDAHPTPRPATRTVDAYTRFNLLRATIDQEVAALADGDKAAFLALQDQADAEWLRI